MMSIWSTELCFQDEIRDFCVGVLTAPPPPTFAMPSFMQKGAHGGHGGQGHGHGQSHVDHLLASAAPITPGSTPTRKTAPRRRRTQVSMQCGWVG